MTKHVYDSVKNKRTTYELVGDFEKKYDVIKVVNGEVKVLYSSKSYDLAENFYERTIRAI